MVALEDAAQTQLGLAVAAAALVDLEQQQGFLLSLELHIRLLSAAVEPQTQQQIHKGAMVAIPFLAP